MSLLRRIEHSVAWRSRRVWKTATNFVESVQWSRKKFEPVDPEIEYPCYKSFDKLIDVERLKGLDQYVTDRVRRILGGGEGDRFHSGFAKKNVFDSVQPGPRLIPLTVSKKKWVYGDLDNPDVWERSAYADQFPELMDFIDTLPFERTARIIIMCDDEGRQVTAHRDHVASDVLHEFIWFRTNLDKPFYMQDWQSDKKVYVESHSAWFDTVNQFHGGDRTGRMAISMRVDGTFSKELRAQIPVPKLNRASTSALWAAKSR